METEAEHILALSRELLDDLELGRLAADKLLLKANRLARLAGSEEIRKWLSCEMQGYNGSDPLSLLYMSLTGRWTNFEDKKGYYGPFTQQIATIEALNSQMQASRLTSVSGDASVGVINTINRNQQSLSSQLSKLAGISSRVLGLLHSFVSNVFYERQFADVAESTFARYKSDVDGMIAERAGDVLTKLPSVVARLKEGDVEAISQALTTCRRILETFADAVFPPNEGTFDIGGNHLKLDASKHQNRINAYIAQRTESSSRRTRLRQNLANLFDRVSTGVHHDVAAEEAYSLFLNVYLFLGEVLNLGEPVAPETLVD